jgi:hypothetical protein
MFNTNVISLNYDINTYLVCIKVLLQRPCLLQRKWWFLCIKEKLVLSRITIFQYHVSFSLFTSHVFLMISLIMSNRKFENIWTDSLIHRCHKNDRSKIFCIYIWECANTNYTLSILDWTRGWSKIEEICCKFLESSKGYRKLASLCHRSWLHTIWTRYSQYGERCQWDGEARYRFYWFLWLPYVKCETKEWV